MLLSEVEYARPTSVEEALSMLGSRENARPLAGGQTLINVMKLRIAGPDRVVDVSRIPELKGVRRLSDGSLEIGAATTYAELVESVEVWASRPLLAEVGSLIADVQVRNRGTIGGNVCLNLPTSHFPPVLVALGAELTIAGPDGERRVPAEQFFESSFVTAVQAGELLTTVHVPSRPQAGGDAFAAMAAGVESQSIVHVAVSLRDDGGVRDARIALGCVAATPVRASAAERALEGADGGEESVRAAVHGLASSLAPVGDVNATGDFKAQVAEVLVRPRGPRGGRAEQAAWRLSRHTGSRSRSRSTAGPRLRRLTRAGCSSISFGTSSV